MTEDEIRRYDELLEVLDYDEESGLFTWLVPISQVKKGATAGYVGSNGYTKISFKKRTYLAHRLGFYSAYGFLPNMLDHINNLRTDNRIVNLRPASVVQNGRNKLAERTSFSKYKGVTFSKVYKQRKKPWYANIHYEGKTRFLGSYTTEEEARDSYRKKAKVVFAEFYNNGEISK